MQAHQPVIIFANIANGGDEAGRYMATLKINGQVEEIRTGRVGGHGAVPLKFEIIRPAPGIYEVDINGQKSYFTVTDDAVNRAMIPKNLVLIGFIICAIAVVLVSILIILRRCSAY